MMPHVDYKNVGSSFYIDMGNQKKDVVVSARKKGCNKYQMTQGWLHNRSRSKVNIRV